MTETINLNPMKSSDGTSTQSKDYLDPLEVEDTDYDDFDPTPQYLYDDTNGEPPLSWKERQELEDSKYREQYGWA